MNVNLNRKGERLYTMNNNILSLVSELKIDDFFSMMASIIDDKIDAANIVRSLNMAQEVCGMSISKCIKLAETIAEEEYRKIAISLEEIKSEVNKNFLLLNDAIQLHETQNFSAAERCFNEAMLNVHDDIFLETISGQTPLRSINDSRYKQVFRLNFGRTFYRVRSDIVAESVHPNELFHRPYSMQHLVRKSRYSVAELQVYTFQQI